MAGAKASLRKALRRAVDCRLTSGLLLDATCLRLSMDVRRRVELVVAVVVVAAFTAAVVLLLVLHVVACGLLCVMMVSGTLEAVAASRLCDAAATAPERSDRPGVAVAEEADEMTDRLCRSDVVPAVGPVVFIRASTSSTICFTLPDAPAWHSSATDGFTSTAHSSSSSSRCFWSIEAADARGG